MGTYLVKFTKDNIELKHLQTPQNTGFSEERWLTANIKKLRHLNRNLAYFFVYRQRQVPPKDCFLGILK